MHQINTRGTYLCTQQALPYLLKASNPHVLNISPPIHSTLSPRWFAPHVAYTMAKLGMSLCVLGMAEEFRSQGVAVNALWPRTAIDTEAIRLIAGQDARKKTRRPQIVADAAYWIITQPSRTVTGRFFLDDEVLRNAGVTDFSRYRGEGVRENDLMGDFFL
jgi:citronellol/citronellal dehydrogenase